MPLKVSDGIGAWIKDFQKSDAPQFKNSSKSDRRDQAIAAYLGAKRGDTNEALLPTKDVEKVIGKGAKPIKNVKNSDQTKQSPMSRAKALAKKARDAQKTNENNSAPQTAAHRRAMMIGVMKKRAQDNEKARQALKDPDHNPAWANSKSKLEATLVRGKEVHDKTFANRTQADNFAKKNGGRVRQVGRVFYVFKESVNKKVEYAEYQFKNRRQAEKAHEYFKSVQGQGLDVEDDSIHRGQLRVDAHKNEKNKDITKHHNHIMKNFPGVKATQTYGPGEYPKESVNIDKLKSGVNEGRVSQQHPLEDHPYHRKTDAQLIYIGKDAHAAAEAMKGHNTEKENKYRDQANDAATVRHFRKKSGMPDWYKKKYGHGVKESVEESFKVGDKVKAKKGSQSSNQRHYERKVGTVVKDYKDGDFKVNFGGNDDASIAGKHLHLHKEGTADRYKMIKKIGDKLNKEKKKAERDAMRHAKRDNEYQTDVNESSASDEGARAASQGQSYSSNPYPKDSPNHLEWSKGHNKARARRLDMGESKEEFTKKHFHKNEDENRHTENGVKLVNKFGTSAENIKMGGIAARHNMRGSISRKDQQDRDALVRKYYPKLKEGTSVKKTNEATQFKVDIDGLPPTFIQGKSVGEIMANLRKIVKQPSLIKDVERVTDYTVKKTYRAKSQGREVDEAANPDEGSMALTQLEFIEYAAEELSDHIKDGGDFPEWMQNKLTKAHTTMEGLHSSMGDHGGDDDENEKDD